MSVACRLWRSLEAHPWLWSGALVAPLILFPAIDIGVSSLFFDPALKAFPARTQAFYEWVRREMPQYLFGGVIALLLTWAAGEVLRRPLLGVTRRLAAYVMLSLALGPGLVVNVILKDNWGRPRPSTIAEFGGPDTYVRPLVPSNQCDDNCSFSSGHGALGFWPVALALLAPPAWRPLAVGAAMAFGAVVGFVRIAQGGHFLSDVVFSALITIGISLWLYRRLILAPAALPQKNNPPIPGERA